MGTTSGSREVCAACRHLALSSREIGPFGRIDWRDGDRGKCMNRRSPTWNVDKQPLMSCRAFEGFGGGL
jgi:hypothetical protein